MGKQSSVDWEDLSFKLGTVFKPSTPVTIMELFAGRKAQILKICDAINTSGRHAILYGERGVGKTSCSNMIFPRLTSGETPTLIPQVNCMTSDTFGSIWKRVFEEVKIKFDMNEELAIPEYAERLMNAYTEPYGDGITADVVRRFLHELAREYLVVIVLDEFDTISDRKTRQEIADLIKFLSDRNVPATIILIGVADDVDKLLGDHRSIERCVSQIQMPRMSRDDIEEVVSKGLIQYGMSIDSEPKEEVSRIARGLPHYAHLLGLHAGRIALERKSLKVTEKDMSIAVSRSLDDVQQSTKSEYSRATTSAREDALHRHVLLAAALVEPDDMGCFYPKSIARPLSKIRGKPCKIDTFIRHLDAFCEERRGSVLEKDVRGEKNRYRFTNPLLQPYVVMRGMNENLITAKALKELRQPDDQRRLF